MLLLQYEWTFYVLPSCDNNQAALGSDAETRSSRRVHKDVGYMIVFFGYSCSENLVDMK
jgi:hypothetical protein